MPAVYGTIFRTQERTRPWWLQALVWIGTTIAAIVLFWMIYRGCQSMWQIYYLMPQSRRVSNGRLFALCLGFLMSGACLNHFRHTLFLSPPVRDLATTPAPPLRILRLCLRLGWIDAGRLLAIALCLYSFFTTAWRDFLPIPWWSWITPLSGLSSVLAALAIDTSAQCLFVSANLIAATIGIGGLAPAAFDPQSRAGKWVLGFLSFVLNAASFALALLLIAAIVNLFFKAFVPIADVFRACIETPGSLANTLYAWFPSVVFFDILQSSLYGPVHVFHAASFRALVWLTAIGASMFLFLRSGLSPRNRLPWAGEPAGVQPADGNADVERNIDPDNFSGPVERWWIRRFGRMGRAIVRVVYQSCLAASIDYHFRRMLAFFPIFLAAEWLILTLILFIGEIFGLFKSMSEVDASHPLAAFLMFMAAGMRTAQWSGQAEVMQAGTQKTPPTLAEFLRGKTQGESVTRGNPGVKLSDIYPIGFSDAVVLPMTFAVPFILLQGVLAFIEGVALGIPLVNLKWGLAIVVPGVLQLQFVTLIIGATGDRLHFSRSRARRFLTTMLLAVSCAVAFIGLIALFAFMGVKLSGRGYAWLAWVGSMHILLVFNAALYMLARWFYVRRRFDAEIRMTFGT